MLLVIDVGNSHTVTGLYDGDQLIGKWRFKSDRAKTADEIAVHYHSLFAMEGINTEAISCVVLASVVPTLETALISCCRKYFFSQLTEPVFVVSSQSVDDMVTVSVPHAGEVGADRLVNSIAAYNLYEKPLIVIDFGTAITFDCVQSGCEYVGGVILPGIAISLDALSSRTAKLPHIDVTEPPENVIGTTTVGAMTSGIVYGYGSMIDGMVQRIQAEMISSDSGDVKVVATGGMASVIAPYSAAIDTVDPLLTLTGLKMIYDYKLNP